MESMKQISTNTPGVGDMVVFRAKQALSLDSNESIIGHDIAITSGEEGAVYFVDMTTETELINTVVWDGPIPSFTITPEQSHLLIVSGDENVLYQYNMPPHFKMEALLYRSPVTICHVACSTRYIAIATEDPEIKVLQRAATDQLLSIPAHSHGIKSVVFDPTGTMLCSSSEDGTVRVHLLKEDAFSAVQVASFNIIYKAIRDEDVLCRIAWSSTLLAVPVNQGIIDLIDCVTWKRTSHLLLPMGSSTSTDVNIVSFSPNGGYLAAATLEKEIFVWAVESKQVLRSFRMDYSVVGLTWASGENRLMAFNTGGRLGFVQDVIPKGLKLPQGMEKEKKTSQKLQLIEDQAKEGKEEEEEEEEEEEDTHVEAIKASFGFGAAAKAKEMAVDLGLAKDEEEEQVTIPSSQPQRTAPEPFQSGSVPSDGTSAVSLLAWTPLGEIECVRHATGPSSRQENLIKVEFADKTKRGFKFNDNYLFTMATMDEEGAFFAVPRRARQAWDEEEGGEDGEMGDIMPSVVFYRPFESWATNASWHLTLPLTEDAECIAASRFFCAVATSTHCLRLYMTSGIPLALLRLSGRIITMTARENRLAVLYDGGNGQIQYQVMEMTISNARERMRVLAQGIVPLSPPVVDVFASHKEKQMMRNDLTQYSCIQWMGFDERLMLYTVDSIGCVSALASCYDWQWFPIATVETNRSSSIFTLGIVNNTLLYFPLEEGASAPKLRGKHRPVPLQLPLQHTSYPTIPSTTNKKTSERPNNVLWQQIRVSAMAFEDEKHVHEQAEMDKSLILLMKNACTNDQPARVLDLAKCLQLEKSHQIAQKLAQHFGFRTLQTQLYGLYRQVFEYPRQEEGKELYHSTVSQRTSHTSAVAAPVAMNEPLRRQPRLGRQPKPEADPETEPVPSTSNDEQISHVEKENNTLIAAKSTPSSASVVTKPRPIIEHSVAPVNPFLKRSQSQDTSSTSANKPSTKGGLERLAKFTSPPPAKRTRPWK